MGATVADTVTSIHDMDLVLHLKRKRKGGQEATRISAGLISLKRQYMDYSTNIICRTVRSSRR